MQKTLVSYMTYDLVIIGGGINGTAIACDAAGRGLSVLLCERDDLAAHTSSASTKLIHGGLRYLEHYEFRLVRESLREREILLKKAPHIIWPQKFVMPHTTSIRPAWMIRLGLFLYDHLASRNKLDKSQAIDLHHHLAGSVLKDHYKKGFIYSDCWGDDARLVVLNARAAKDHGAVIRTRTEFLNAKREATEWHIQLKSKHIDQIETIRAKMLINAAGPWVDDIALDRLHTTNKKNIVHIKGSHIIVKRLHADNYAYVLQNTDQRIIFVIPYLNDYSLIGTTDCRYSDDLGQVQISDDEIHYLCIAVSQYFKQSISKTDIVWSYSGVRPLKVDNANNPSQISREYELEVNHPDNCAPLLNVFGGKLTTHRVLAEQVMKKIRPFFPHLGSQWTEHATLPGGDIPEGDVSKYTATLIAQFPKIDPVLIERYARYYGTCAEQILDEVSTLDDLGEHFGAGLYQKELQYLVDNEFAKSAEDVLWRRTKLGLFLSTDQINRVHSALQALTQEIR